MTSDKAYTSQQRLDTLLGNQTDWANFGTMTNSWSKAGGSAKYRKDLSGNVLVQMVNITMGTNTNGTTIFAAAQGLPAGFRPGDSLWIPVRSTNEGGQQSCFMFHPDGHIECWGFAGVSGGERADCNVSFYAEN